MSFSTASQTSPAYCRPGGRNFTCRNFDRKACGGLKFGHMFFGGVARKRHFWGRGS